MTSRPLPDTIGMCGVDCALTSCFRSGRCHGCHSEDPNQKRTSKWKCRIRTCVIGKGLNHCGECGEFPCLIRKSLDKRYLGTYRINLQDNIRLLTELGPEEWAEQSRTRHTCPSCGGCIDPYNRTCYECRRVMR